MVKERLTGRPMALSLCAPPPQGYFSSIEWLLERLLAELLVAVGAAILAPRSIEPARLQCSLGRMLVALALGKAEAQTLLIGTPLALGGLLLLAVAVQVDDAAHHASGPIILLGSTILSNSSADT